MAELLISAYSQLTSHSKEADGLLYTLGYE